MAGSITISSLMSPNTWPLHHHPPLSHHLCPAQAFWPTKALWLYHTPTFLWQTGLISPAATLHPASKRTAVEKAPQGPLRMDSWIKHVPEASFLSLGSAEALIRHSSRELPTVTSPSFPEQKGTVLRSQTRKRGPPSNTVTSHYIYTLRESAKEKDKQKEVP